MTVNSAISYGKRQVGRSESPAGSNRCFAWEHVKKHWGVNLQGNPWCGAYVIDVAYHGGLKLPWQMVSVSYVEQWGRKHGRWHNGIRGLKKGDLVVLFGHGRHVEIAAADGKSNGYWSLGGNTSPASQWNGGKVAYQWRSASKVVGYVRIYDKYPKPPAFKPVKFPLRTVPVKHYFGSKTKFKNRSYIHNGTATWSDKNGVRQIQTWLKYLGYYKGKVTGGFNPATHAAVVAYQKKHKYKKPNGAVGGGTPGKGGTWTLLQKSVYNKRYK